MAYINPYSFHLNRLMNNIRMGMPIRLDWRRRQHLSLKSLGDEGVVVRIVLSGMYGGFN